MKVAVLNTTPAFAAPGGRGTIHRGIRVDPGTDASNRSDNGPPDNPDRDDDRSYDDESSDGSVVSVSHDSSTPSPTTITSTGQKLLPWALTVKDTSPEPDKLLEKMVQTPPPSLKDDCYQLASSLLEADAQIQHAVLTNERL